MEFHEVIAFSKDLNILFVDDDQNFSKETIELLEMFFNKVDVASNGQEGIEKYNEFYSKTYSYYDLVISDIIMPIMDGEEFVTNIKKINEKQSIVIVSASTESSALINFIKLGIEDFLVKPISQKSLIECIYKVSKVIYNDKILEKSSVGKSEYASEFLIPDDNDFKIY